MTRGLDRILALTVVCLVAADWLTKFWVTSRMALGESIAVIPEWFYLVHRRNPGVAFSFFADLPDGWRTPLLTGLSLLGVVIFGRMVMSNGDRVVRAAATVVLGGALGNLGDRLLNGYVTDFVKFPHFPAFNVADISITFGVIALVYVLEGPPRRRQQEADGG